MRHSIILVLIAYFGISYGVRGPKKHLKRLASPRHWMLDKMSGIFSKKVYTKDIVDASGTVYTLYVYKEPFEITLIANEDNDKKEGEKHEA